MHFSPHVEFNVGLTERRWVERELERGEDRADDGWIGEGRDFDVLPVLNDRVSRRY